MITLESFLPKAWLDKSIAESDVSSLPTISEIKEKLAEYENNYTVERENRRIDEIRKIQKNIQYGDLSSLKCGLKATNKEDALVELQNIIDNAKFEHDDPSLFILTETKNYMTLKPNITKKHFLYRGQCEFWDECQPTVRRKEKEQQREILHLVENIKREEFNILLDSHPLFSLLKSGIKLSNDKIFQVHNPYGLAQHYGFKTSLLDLTSDIDVASFFATTDYDNLTDSYSPHSQSEGYGVLYVYHMTVDFSFLTQNDGLSTIGLQPFSRSGDQKGFLWMPTNNHTNFDFHTNPYVTKIFFKHDCDIAENIFRNMYEEKNIYKKDILSIKAREILSSTIFSIEAFTQNLKNNSKDNPSIDPDINMSLLQQEGISISSSKTPMKFSENELDIYYRWVEIGGWEEFCDQIIFPNDVGDKLKNELISIKDNPKYKSYFLKS